MKNRNDKNRQFSSVFWVYIRTGGIGLASAIGGTAFLFIEKIPERALVATAVLTGVIILVPFIVALSGGRAEPFDETVQKNRYESLSAATNCFVEILLVAAFALMMAEAFEIKVSAGAALMFAVALLCLLHCLFFGALESRSKKDAKAYNKDDVAGEENAF